MVMSNFEHVPAAGVAHRCCSHLIDALGTPRSGPPVVYWCASHGDASGLMCTADARRHEAEEHHGDASFTSEVALPFGLEMVDPDGRTMAREPDGVTIALMVFYVD